ncbi:MULTISPECIES: hypothetical protein [Spirulina sp. CCY15215]|nr:hypothetical protein [Spirulina major]
MDTLSQSTLLIFFFWRSQNHVSRDRDKILQSIPSEDSQSVPMR